MILRTQLQLKSSLKWVFKVFWENMRITFSQLTLTHFEFSLNCLTTIFQSLQSYHFSEEMLIENVKNNLIKVALNMLKEKEYFTEEQLNSGITLCFCHRATGFLLANVYNSTVKQEMIDMNAVNIMIDFKNKLDKGLATNIRNNELELIKADSVTILSQLLSDDELNNSSLTQEIVTTIINMLHGAINSNSNDRLLNGTKFYYRYVIVETSSFILAERILIRLIRISVNDKIKQMIFDNNGLSLAFTLFREGNDREQERTCELLCSLCFNENVRKSVKENQEIMKLIEEKSVTSGNRVTKDYCIKIIQMVNQTLHGRVTSAKLNRNSILTNGHIMISYNHASQSQCLKLNEKLKEKGFKTWIDVEMTMIDLHDSMAKAVEGASVVLVCYSDGYKNSSNCRIEAQYAIDCKKPIIAVRMERKFKPDGWLGIILAGKFYVDLSSLKEDTNTPNIDLLIKQINSIKNSDNAESQSVNRVEYPLQTPRPLSSTQRSQKDKIKKWSCDQVKDWFIIKEQTELYDVLTGINGLALTSLWELKRNDIGTLCNQLDAEILKSKKDVPFIKKMTFFQQLDELFQ